mmetsp:Transcript_94861/g.245593  ORF Transcript_94861/g.245593 Transcript_94861/m.245593 type:complete len:281 (+) Transcript_94861:835-1677(+)
MSAGPRRDTAAASPSGGLVPMRRCCQSGWPASGRAAVIMPCPQQQQQHRRQLPRRRMGVASRSSLQHGLLRTQCILKSMILPLCMRRCCGTESDVMRMRRPLLLPHRSSPGVWPSTLGLAVASLVVFVHALEPVRSMLSRRVRRQRNFVGRLCAPMASRALWRSFVHELKTCSSQRGPWRTSSSRNGWASSCSSNLCWTLCLLLAIAGSDRARADCCLRTPGCYCAPSATTSGAASGQRLCTASVALTFRRSDLGSLMKRPPNPLSRVSHPISCWLNQGA